MIFIIFVKYNGEFEYNQIIVIADTLRVHTRNLVHMMISTC